MPCGPPGTILSLAPFTNLAEGSAESLTQHSPAFRHEGRELALKQLSCTAAPAVRDRRRHRIRVDVLLTFLHSLEDGSRDGLRRRVRYVKLSSHIRDHGSRQHHIYLY